jgi:hypothetical protein
MKTKKADSKLLSIWWFAILTLIGVAVVISTLIFFSNKIDVRLYESDILTNRIVQCLIQNGQIDETFLNDNFNIFQKCEINQSIIEGSGNYFIKINLNSENNLLKELKYGNFALEKDCSIGLAMLEAKNFPRCIERKVPSFNSKNELITLRVLAGSNNEYRG